MEGEAQASPFFLFKSNGQLVAATLPQMNGGIALDFSSYVSMEVTTSTPTQTDDKFFDFSISKAGHVAAMESCASPATISTSNFVVFLDKCQEVSSSGNPHGSMIFRVSIDVLDPIRNEYRSIQSYKLTTSSNYRGIISGTNTSVATVETDRLPIYYAPEAVKGTDNHMGAFNLDVLASNPINYCVLKAGTLVKISAASAWCEGCSEYIPIKASAILIPVVV